MDNNFSDILGIFKRLDEGTMARAEQHSKGPKFTGYWKGTDKATPGNHMVGASESVEECGEPMSLEDRLRARWEETKRSKGLTEYGMTTGGTAVGGAGATNNPANPVDAQKMAKELNQTQQNLNKLKSVGVNLPTGVSQAAKSTVATAANPGAVTGQGMDQNAKKTTMGLGQEMEKLMATGNQSQVQQVANAIKQAKMDNQ
jgi:hypothetical protein